MPIGVSYNRRKYRCQFSYNGEHIGFTNRNTPEECFYLDYKPTKEFYIKKSAEIEYTNGNISKECYEAMMNYKVEITD